MEDWRIRHNSRFHLPPGLDFKNTDDDAEPYREEDEPMFQHSSPPGLAKKYYLAIFLLSILIIMHTIVPNFQTWELRKLRLWRWQLVAIFTFYGPSFSRVMTNGVLNAIQNSNAMMLKGKLPHFYAAKKSFARFLSSVMVLIVWFFFIEIPLKKLGKFNMFLKSITLILSCVVLSVTLWGTKMVVWEVISVRFYRRNYLEQIKEAVFAHYMLRCMLNPLNDPSQMTEEREKIIDVGPNQMTFCQWRLMCAADTLNDWQVWNLINHVRKGKVLSEMLQPVLQGYRELKNASNLNLWNGVAMFVSEEIVKRVSRSESGVSRAGLHAPLMNPYSPCLNRFTCERVGMRLPQESLTRSDTFRALQDREINFPELLHCMPKLMADEALKLIGATDGKFGTDELFSWVIHTFQQQKGLELSHKDTNDALQDLHGHIDAVVLALLLFAWLAMLDTVYVLPVDQQLGQHFYVMILVLALVVAYVYHTIWDLNRNGIRFFFRHPLRVGDTCTIDGEKMQVKRLRIYYTVFLTMAGDDVFHPSALLLATEFVKDPPLLLRRA